ncbi:hypothetical protein L1077_06265 [Pseudoalteromonas luteoviolacea]|uniref:Uncharacterized protein n=2 Tax=Pseudoalteromonas luteoviolacea TaxID=43657 RepID=A0A167EZI6_9GAMM|nr:hypothetical protein [Pseudoalteromonas luteoviolacea]KZN51411.1 hypothetical protein N476_13570 [Pseudoalteromonas luteoviolacea H33]KZN71418.1 hypothetical protein N477_03850 [Pseudoalteromonas luteoviolacea H33-S]MBQ4876774.1 hypothetical protein [Pseudoalteromonas luteoviolacea]MBQ4905437.1 hypothetical protein [Pseudoalteromonas luteoviolacea]MCF6439028.1 hypothetical protein [Pseudoalteromonas luteoviolacea]
MKKPNYKKELIMLPLLLISIALCIGGHFILQPSYQNNHWAEYSLAALPFLMFAIVIIAIKIAIKADKEE